MIEKWDILGNIYQDNFHIRWSSDHGMDRDYSFILRIYIFTEKLGGSQNPLDPGLQKRVHLPNTRDCQIKPS